MVKDLLDETIGDVIDDTDLISKFVFYSDVYHYAKANSSVNILGSRYELLRRYCEYIGRAVGESLCYMLDNDYKNEIESRATFKAFADKNNTELPEDFCQKPEHDWKEI